MLAQWHYVKKISIILSFRQRRPERQRTGEANHITRAHNESNKSEQLMRFLPLVEMTKELSLDDTKLARNDINNNRLPRFAAFRLQ